MPSPRSMEGKKSPFEDSDDGGQGKTDDEEEHEIKVCLKGTLSQY